MKRMTETKFLLYTVSAIFILMMVRIFQPQLSNIYNPINYTGIHTLLEIFCIAISVVIFLYGIKNFHDTKSNKMLLLAFTFLTVGMIDLLHTLSFKGMPFFITESSVAKATWFWIAARAIQSLLMLGIILIPERRLKRDYRTLAVPFSILLTGIIGFLVFTYETQLPILVNEGKGTTLLKNSMEYAISFILFISLMVTLYHYYLKKSEQDLNLALGIVFLLLMELIFTIYQSVLDLDNFLGHMFKVFGFYYVLKGFYFSIPDVDTDEKESTSQKVMSDQPGIFFMLKEKNGRFYCATIIGELLTKLGIKPEEFIRRVIAEMPIPEEELNQSPRLSTKYQNNIIFEMVYLDKTILISIKAAIDDREQNVILGTAMDATEILPKEVNPLSLKQRDQDVRIVM